MDATSNPLVDNDVVIAPKDDGDASPACRICYGHSNPNDVLIVPCACRGSIEYVHAGCLRAWIATTENGEARHTCPLCRSRYATRPGACVLSWRNAIAAVVLAASAVADMGNCYLLALMFFPDWVLPGSGWVKQWGPCTEMSGWAWSSDIWPLRAVAVANRNKVSATILFFGFLGSGGRVWNKYLMVMEDFERSAMLIYDRKRGKYL